MEEDELYVVGQGTRLHLRSCQVCQTGAPIRKPTPWERQSYALCTKCAQRQSRCIICAQAGSWQNCPCPHNHVICPGCLDEHVWRQCTLQTTPSELCCPCGRGCFSASDLSRTQHALWAREVTASTTTPPASSATGYVASVLDEVFTLRCPSCSAAFESFEGCLALECRCGAHFCALCMQPSESSPACHAHVRTCQLNVRDSYYMRLEDWWEVQRKRARVRLSKYLRETAGATSTSFALALWMHLDPVLRERSIEVNLSDFVQPLRRAWERCGQLFGLRT